MKRSFVFISTAAIAACTLPAIAQNLVDATRFSSTGINGTARYKSMGGAFGALGGDPTSMNDNPAGIAIYRNTSEFSLTPNLSIARTKTGGELVGKKKDRDFTLGNLSYVLAVKTDNFEHLVNFSMGVGINHSEGCSRKYIVHRNGLTPSSSFGAYLANLANTALILNGKFDNPGYLGSDAGWRNSSMPLLGLMGYNSYAIDNIVDAQGNSTGGVASFDQMGGYNSYSDMYVREENRTDEYNLSIAANWDDFIYAGLSVGIVDFNSTINSEYSEYYDDQAQSYTYYDNDLETKGSGVNIKLGAIVKPTDSWRIGLAVHTPTWYEMKDIYDGRMCTNAETDDYKGEWIYAGSAPYEYHYRFSTPWKYQFSTAYVFGTRGLLSFEYDMDDYRSMRYSESNDNNYPEDFSIQKQIIKDYMQEMHTFKVGAEFRATPTFSIRAGYAHQTSPYKNDVFDCIYQYPEDPEYIYSSSTKPNYSLQGKTDYISGGFGWRIKNVFVDFACVHKTQHGKAGAFPNIEEAEFEDGKYRYTVPAVTASHSPLKTKTLSFDLTLGVKF